MSVHLEKLGNVGLVRLERPKALNSLTAEMCEAMYQTLSQWRTDPEVAVIWLEGAGEKGFCAGGDVKLVREAAKNLSNFDYAIKFFWNEYKNDLQLSQIEKPIISWCNGITMGGGMGLMQSTSYRVVTETTVLAMPEISIGLYPDVGAMYWLTKLPEGVGLFLALTAARFGPHDAMDLELADFYIKNDFKSTLWKECLEARWSNDNGENHSLVTESLRKHATQLRLPSTVKKTMPLLKPLAKAENAVDAYQQLQEISKKSAWVAESFENLKKGSPLSAALIFEYFKRAKEMSRAQIFETEYYLSLQMSLDSDFLEGVRSLLVDKDSMPKWKHTHVSDVEQEEVLKLFANPFKTNPKLSKEFEKF